MPALNPDVAIVHAQQADRHGNVMMWGITGVQKEAVLAARRALVTVEEIVDELAPRPGAVVIPSWAVSHVACVPGGAHPSYAQGYSTRDNAFYLAWDAISADRDRFHTGSTSMSSAGLQHLEHRRAGERSGGASTRGRGPDHRLEHRRAGERSGGASTRGQADPTTASSIGEREERSRRERARRGRGGRSTELEHRRAGERSGGASTEAAGRG